jgi:diguanylate cyclase (GGDEF)-like protein
MGVDIPKDIQLSQWQKKAANYSDLKQKVLDIEELKRQKAESDIEKNLDPLTGLYNRRLFEKISEDLDNIPDVGIVIFDTDNFKQINDNYGHTQGDEVLKRIAQIMKDNCHTRLPSADDEVRPFDFPFRIGGDEFALILIQIQPEDVSKVINRITDNLKQENISLSSGFAVTSKDLNFKQAFIQADQNMYLDKQSKQITR